MIGGDKHENIKKSCAERAQNPLLQLPQRKKGFTMRSSYKKLEVRKEPFLLSVLFGSVDRLPWAFASADRLTYGAVSSMVPRTY
ncbi:hypothetical protein ACP70R_031326 [Stipagrostis hirtigluma subsp. patula]